MSELLRSKIGPPRLGHAVMARPRLTACLNEGLGGRIILVSAPAGYGKSMLVAGWIAELDRSCCSAWLSLGPEDNDPGRFLTYLAAALEGAVPHLSQRIRPAFNGAEAGPALTPDATAEQLAPLFNALAALDRHLVLVLDDYDVVADCAVHGLVSCLLNHLPETVTLVIVTRVDPPLPLARLRTRGQMTTIRAADLRFTTGEAADFLGSVMGLQLSDASIATLARRTEGWIAGLQLAGLSLQHHRDGAAFLDEFAGDDHNVRSYLVDEVLAGQPAEVQRFLLVTSILERLTAALCDAVLSGNDGNGPLDESATLMPSQQVLEYLEQRNLFIVPLDDHCQWYRYHTLFAELLRFHLWREQRDSLPLFHERAACWLEQHGYIEEAMRQALAVGNISLAEAIRFRSEQAGVNGRLIFWLNRFKRLSLPLLQRPVPATPLADGHGFARGEYGPLLVHAAARADARRQGTISPHRAAGQPVPDVPYEPLSKREAEVLELLATGISYQEIAQRLFISLPTVKTHVTHIYGKLGIHSREQALERASISGLLQR